jgi:hypothetical protein
MRISGELTKSGVFEYTRADGQVVREYRPPEEVTKADSLATIDDLPVTIGHPSVGMSADTFGKLAVGHARSPERADSGKDVLIRGVLTVGRKDAVEGVGAGKLADTSMGYQCEIDPTPGVTPEGQRYDAVQRSIIYNHVALLPAGGARLGTRLDGAVAPVLRLDAAGNQIEEAEKPIMKVTIKKDGKDFEVERGSDEHVAYLEATNAATSARADAADAELKAFRADAAKRERASLEDTARGVLGKDEKFDGKSDRQIREAVIAKRLPAVKCDALDDVHVGAYFDAALSVVAPAAPKAKSAPNALIKGLARKDGEMPFKKGGESGEDDEDGDEGDTAKKAKDAKKKSDSAWERC